MAGKLSRIPRRTWLQAAALLVALLAAWPLLSGEGLLNTRGGGDSPFLLQRLHQLVAALEDGHFPVRWMPDANYGYGYPFFNYYAPLSIYVAAIFRLAGFSYVHSLQLAQLGGFLLAAWASFNLAERWFKNGWAALLVSAGYTLAPFHLVNVYVRGDSLAEFWAMALYPLVLLAADKITSPQNDTRPALLFFALSYAALVLSHNISALIFSPFLLFYLLLRLGQKRDKFGPLVGAASAALVLGLALAAWFWVPALAEKSLVQTEPITQGYFHYSAHFWGRELVQTSVLFDYEVAGRRAFRMGLVQVLLAAAGVLALLWQLRKVRRTGAVSAFFILAALAVATFMVTPLSRPLWETVPLLPFTQFPWRFLSVQALAGALVTGAIVLLAEERIRPGLTAALLLLLLVTALGDLTTEHLALTDADVTAARLAEYEWFTGNIGSTVSAEYLPYTVQPRPYTSPWLERGTRNQTRAVEGEASAQLLARAATAQQWEVSAGTTGASVVFPTLYWSGWTATVDGEPVPARAATGSGLLAVNVPPGAHDVILALERTPVRLVSEIVSLLALGLLLLMAIPRVRGKRINGRAVLFALAIAILTAFVLRLWPASSLSPATLNWDFAQMGYLHHAPQGIPFSSGARLLGYEYSTENAAAGETITVTLSWQEEPGRDSEWAALALATPAVHRYWAAPLLPAEAQAQGSFTFSIPENAPAGLYVPRLTIPGAVPLLPTGESRGNLFLRPLRITAGASAGATAGTTETSDAESIQVKADEITVVGDMPVAGGASGPVACDVPQPAKLLVPLSWYTPSPLSENYVASVRLLDKAGQVLAQCDVQPGYGFQPSSDWPAGQWVNDLLALPLPPTLPEGGPYPLVVRLYPATRESVLTRRLGELVWRGETVAFQPERPLFTLPKQITSTEATFGEEIVLRGYQIDGISETLSLTLYWEALATGEEDYVRFVQLIDPATGQIVERLDGSTVQRDGTPRQESYPTSQWTAGEIVADPVSLDLDGVPTGDYRLLVGFYPASDSTNRLPVLSGTGEPVAGDALSLPTPITIANN